jgi:hypothetical protein
MILEVPGLFIRLVYRLASVIYSGWGYFVHFEIGLMYAFGLGKLPPYLGVPLRIYLMLQGLRFWASLLWSLVRGILYALPDDLAIKTPRLALIHLPQIWRAIV